MNYWLLVAILMLVAAALLCRANRRESLPRWKVETREMVVNYKYPPEVVISIVCPACGRRYYDAPRYNIRGGELPPYCLCGTEMGTEVQYDGQ